MGDRANVHVAGVYLYTHWNGEALPFAVQSALRRKARWDNEPYLARIVFCTMVAGDYDSETGFGISSELVDNEHPIIKLLCDIQTVSFVTEKGEVLKEIGFEEYTKMSDEELSRFLNTDKMRW